MTQNISRRSVATGLAWSVPAVAVATSAPALAASSPTTSPCTWSNIPDTYCPSAAELNAGYFDPALFGPTSDGTYSTTAGRVAPASTANNWGFKNQTSCPDAYRGSVTIKFHNRSGESYIPAPTITFPDGTTYTGAATLGNVLSGGAIAGFRGSTTFLWNDSQGSEDLDWNGAVVTAPYEFSYTAPDRSLQVGIMALTYTMRRYSGGVTAYTDIRSTETAFNTQPPAETCAALGLAQG